MNHPSLLSAKHTVFIESRSSSYQAPPRELPSQKEKDDVHGEALDHDSGLQGV